MPPLSTALYVLLTRRPSAGEGLSIYTYFLYVCLLCGEVGGCAIGSGCSTRSNEHSPPLLGVGMCNDIFAGVFEPLRDYLHHLGPLR